MRTIIFILLFLPFTAYAEVNAPSPVALLLFAHSLVELHDEAGRYIKTVPPIMEYRKFTNWNPSELSSSPDKFDAIALFSNKGGYSKESITVHLEVSAKVGRLILDGEIGVTDIERGLEGSQWRKPELSKSIKVDTISTKHAQRVTFKDIDIKRIQDKYYYRGEWPFKIKVSTWLTCSTCDASERIETMVDVIPGD